MVDKSFLQWPFFETRHRKLAENIDAWAASHVSELTADEHTDLDGTCRTLVRAMGEAEWTRYAVPAGGGGLLERLDVRSLCLIRETLGRYHALADFAFAMQGLGSGPLSLFGSPEQRRRYLVPVSHGEKLAAFALSEPEAGSDVASLATTAKEEGHAFVLDGVKTWISNGGIADFYTVFARTEDVPGAKGLSCFVVEADTPGFEITERIDLIAPHPLATLRFNNCRISRDSLDQGLCRRTRHP